MAGAGLMAKHGIDTFVAGSLATLRTGPTVGWQHWSRQGCFDTLVLRRLSAVAVLMCRSWLEAGSFIIYRVV